MVGEREYGWEVGVSTGYKNLINKYKIKLHRNLFLLNILLFSHFYVAQSFQ